MKRLIVLVLILLAFDVAAKDLDKSFTGSWYKPEQSGHGFSVEVLPDDRVVIYWYVYNPDGTPTFLVGIGNISGNKVHADVHHQTGMVFGDFDNSSLVKTYWGTLDFTVNSCNSATLSYNSTMSIGGQQFGSGTISLTKLASVKGLQCSSSPVAGIYQGYFLSDSLNLLIPGFLAVAPNGEFAAYSLDAMAGVGNWSSSGSNFSGNGIAVSADPDFTFSSNVSITGQYSQDHMMIGSYSVTGGDRGSFEFYAVSELYRRGLSLNAISGNYNARNLVSGGTGTATISSTGSISGSDQFGCRYSGQLTVLDPQFNMFEVTITVSSCGISDGVYEGYGAQIDYYNLDDGRGIRMVGTDGRYAGVFDLYR